MYGISQGVESLSPGEVQITFGKDVSFLVVAGKNKRIFWFVFKKMDKKYKVPNIPRFSAEDAVKQANGLLLKEITDTVRFEHIWEKQVSYTLVALEEALFKTWSWGRFACLGDSVHKVSFNIEIVQELPKLTSLKDDPEYRTRRQRCYRECSSTIQQSQKNAEQQRAKSAAARRPPSRNGGISHEAGRPYKGYLDYRQQTDSH